MLSLWTADLHQTKKSILSSLYAFDAQISSTWGGSTYSLLTLIFEANVLFSVLIQKKHFEQFDGELLRTISVFIFCIRAYTSGRRDSKSLFQVNVCALNQQSGIKFVW